MYPVNSTENGLTGNSVVEKYLLPVSESNRNSLKESGYKTFIGFDTREMIINYEGNGRWPLPEELFESHSQISSSGSDEDDEMY